MKARAYQLDAATKVIERFSAGDQRTLCIMATGTGKTVVAGMLAQEFMPHGRVMMLAHRDELIRQAADKLHQMTGIRPEIEKADERSHEGWSLHGKPQIVVSSIQTQFSGSGGKKRMHRFKPEEFKLIIVDECHHAVANSWKAVTEFYASHSDCKIIGITATPDRSDGTAMGKIFQSVAYEYPLPRAIDDGYLVPVVQRSVFIEGLDFSKIRTVGGDLNQGDLDDMMMFEEPLHGVIHATIEQSCGFQRHALRGLRDDEARRAKVAELIGAPGPRKTLVFCTSILHAERTAEIINRWFPSEMATCIHSKLTPGLRADRIASFAAGRTRFLTNVGIATEGFDLPSVELIVMARPTKSRSLHCQMVGRGTRPAENIAGLLGDLPTAEARRNAIASSEKTMVEVLDFVGNCGRHKLVSTVDILGDGFTADECEAARIASEIGPVDVQKALQKSREDIEKKRREAAKARRERELESEMNREHEMARRASLVATTRYDITLVGGEGMRPELLAEYDPRHLSTLRGAKVPTAHIVRMTRDEVRLLATKIIHRRLAHLCTYKQAMVLQRAGFPKSEIKTMSFARARTEIDTLAQNHWKRIG